MDNVSSWAVGASPVPVCDCEFCKLSKRIQETITKRDVDELIKLVNELAELYLTADEDASYYRCIMDGSWPSAHHLLTMALVKAKQHMDTIDSSDHK